MSLSHLCPRDAEIAHIVAHATRERDLCDLCAADAEHQGDTLAATEFTAEAAEWQDRLDAMETTDV